MKFSTHFTYSFWIVLLITAGTCSPVLFNDFAGDDNSIFFDNSFYYEQRSISSLISKNYTSLPERVQWFNPSNKGSGSVAYRPVLSLTYMADAAVWVKNPAGFHLSNLLIHLLTTWLIFLFFQSLISLPVAFWGSLFFGVHPLNIEAVANIGYRGDLLAGFFVVAACYFWMRYRHKGGWLWSGAVLAYFLALFSKECAFLTPVLFLGIDHCLSNKKNTSRNWPYFFLILVSFFYLYSYFHLFPNAALSKGYPWDHLGIKDVLLSNGEILRLYFCGYLWPASVRMLPGLYYPWPGEFSVLMAVLSYILFCIILWLMLRGVAQRKVHGLLLLSMFLFWLPVSNLVPNPNPVAYRYLYLPMVGACGLMSMALIKGCRHPFFKKKVPNIELLFMGGFVVICCLTSFLNARQWFNNFTIGVGLVKSFPGHYKGHEALAMEYYRYGRFNDAARHLELAILDPRMESPAILGLLGDTYLNLGQLRNAYYYYRQVLALSPDFPAPYQGLADYYKVKGNKLLEQRFRQKSAALLAAQAK